jgi:hypothetical protein
MADNHVSMAVVFDVPEGTEFKYVVFALISSGLFQLLVSLYLSKDDEMF